VIEGMAVNPYESPGEAKREGNELTFGDIGFIALATVSGVLVFVIAATWFWMTFLWP